jgi:maltose alpha-D-glucosyltransferase/alpha-amylase
MNVLLFSLPGAPVLYYGDEIGMGDNIYLGDRHGVRTPMQWSPDRNAGFSRANPQRLYSPVIVDAEYLYDAVNVEIQQKNPNSLLWWMKRLIALRQHHRALSRGAFEPLTPTNSKILAFLRRIDDHCLLVVVNLARVSQSVELDLSAFAGRRPVEIFGQTSFPMIGVGPYVLTLSPHAYFWFDLSPGSENAGQTPPPIPTLEVDRQWTELLRGRHKSRFEAAVADALPRRRWFAGRGRAIQRVGLLGSVPLLGRGAHRGEFWLVFVRVEYSDGDPESYVLPIEYAGGDEALRLLDSHPDAVLLKVHANGSGEDGVLFDAVLEPSRVAPLLEAIAGRQTFPGGQGELVGLASDKLDRLAPEPEGL